MSDFSAPATRREASQRLQPVRFRVLDVPSRMRGATDRWAYVEERLQRDGTSLWVVTDYGNVLARDGEWEHEPIPSSRDDAFMARTRYASVEEALAVLDASLESSHV